MKLALKDRDLLVRCLQEMGYQVEEGGVVKGYRTHRKVDFSIRMEKGYGIGFARNREGSYELVADWWGVKGVKQDDFVQKLRDKVYRIQQSYTLQTVLKQTEKEGYTLVERTEEPDGRIRLLLRRWR